jgi:hypothetical protein
MALVIDLAKHPQNRKNREAEISTMYNESMFEYFLPNEAEHILSYQLLNYIVNRCGELKCKYILMQIPVSPA